MERFISFSGGVESTTMCLLYGKGATAIVCDTGDEEGIMYERWDTVEQAMKIIHDNDFTLLRIKPKVYAKGKYVNTLEEYALQYGYFCASNARWCTKEFKIIPIDKFLRNQGNCELMIGLNVDEENNREGNWEAVNTVNYTYPLVEAGLSRIDCKNILAEYGLLQIFRRICNAEDVANVFFVQKKKPKQNIFLIKQVF